MKLASVIGVAGILALGLGAVAVVRGGDRPGAPSRGQASAPTAAARLPRLVDLGAGKCIPCKAMAPILEELKAEYAGRFEVQFIDVWNDPDAAEPYRTRMIPTQVFFGVDGRELARHEGFMSKREILARWKAVGVGL
jgi:thioredoxin 1